VLLLWFLEKKMSENPDRENYQPRTLLGGELRFIEREIQIPTHQDDIVETRKVRILQIYEYSMTDQKDGWYDVPLEEE